jgi:putative endonuclease
MQILSPRIRAAAWETGFTFLNGLPLRWRATPLPEHLQTGNIGEEAAFFFLRRQSFIVVARNWKTGRAPGDLDLVAWEGDTLCFVEVKTRSSRAFASAESAVDMHKRNHLRRLAKLYLVQSPPNTVARFDVVSVYIDPDRRSGKAEFDLFRNAFGWSETHTH